MILLIADCPTPHHTPVFNRLHDEFGERFFVLYLSSASSWPRGWGRVEVRHRHRVWREGIGWLAFFRLLFARDLRVVCLHGYCGALRQLTSVVARFRGVPTVIRSEANVRDELARPRLRRMLKRWYLRGLLGQPEIWTNGLANTAYWQLLGFRRFHYIPYALSRLPGSPEGASALRAELDATDRFVFAFVGRLETIKGIADILAAYDKVRAEVPPNSTALVLAGGGSLESLVLTHFATRPDCHYLGPLPQGRLGTVYAAADVFLVPSIKEPWGWVVNESLGFGTRVIASDEVAAADDLIDEATGRRHPAADPVALAAAMLAEWRQGRRRARILPPQDVTGLMAQRLRELAPTIGATTGNAPDVVRHGSDDTGAVQRR